MSELADLLDVACLTGSVGSILALLSPLSSAERASLHLELVDRLRAQDDERLRRQPTIGAELQLGDASTVKALESIALDSLTRIDDQIAEAQAGRDHLERISCVLVGIGPRREVERRLRPKELVPDSFGWTAGRALLERPDAWVEQVFAEWYPWLERTSHAEPLGHAELMWRSRERFPNLRDVLRPKLGLPMLLDGFKADRWWDRFDDELILAGLVLDRPPPSRRTITISQHPVLNAEADRILERAAARPSFRAALIDASFGKIAGRIQGGLVRGWASLLLRIKPTPSEFAPRLEGLLGLMTGEAPIAEALLTLLEMHTQAGAIDATVLTSFAARALRSKTPKVQKQAERILRVFGVSPPGPPETERQSPPGLEPEFLPCLGEQASATFYIPGSKSPGPESTVEPLHVPTDLLGFVDHETFLRRLEWRAPSQVSPIHLSEALNRLPRIASPQGVRHQGLAKHMAYDGPTGWALRIAFASEVREAMESTARFEGMLTGKDLTDGLLMPGEVDVERRTQGRQMLGLLVAALRLREPVGGVVSAAARRLPSIERIQLPPTEYGTVNSDRIRDFLMCPPPIDDSLIRSLGDEPVIWGCGYPQLAIYHLLRYFKRPGHTDAFVSHQHLLNRSLETSPRLAQDYFKLGATNTGPRPKQKDLATQLLAVGRAPSVDIESTIEQWLAPARSSYEVHRQLVLDLLARGLREGRISIDASTRAMQNCLEEGAGDLCLTLPTVDPVCSWTVISAARLAKPPRAAGRRSQFDAAISAARTQLASRTEL